MVKERPDMVVVIIVFLESTDALRSCVARAKVRAEYQSDQYSQVFIKQCDWLTEIKKLLMNWIRGFVH